MLFNFSFLFNCIILYYICLHLIFFSIKQETLIRAQKLLQKDADQKRIFIQNGHLATVQKILYNRNEKDIRDACRAINRLFPEKAVKFYSPSLETDMLKMIQG